MKTNTNQREPHLLYPELSYKIQGAIYEIRSKYGSGHKEVLYHRLLEELLENEELSVDREVRIEICSQESGEVVGWYQPDLIVEGKIILEVKSKRMTVRQDEKQLYFYLKNSNYELGYLVNFGSGKLFVKRIVFSNSNKPWLQD